MTTVSAPIAAGVSVDADSFGDLTPSVVVTVDWAEGGSIAVTFADELSPATAAAVRRRIVSRSRAEEELRADAEAFLGVESPDPAALREQVERLTRLVAGV